MERVSAHPIKFTAGSRDEQRGICSHVDADTGIPCGRPVLDPIHTVIKETRVRGTAKPMKIG